ncbi:MAG: hypothetical protein JW776_04185 [Candidatus Lokiarchaeota archaeon]|nr:hypothetical protein [Candidatus Lokiarchaeota archaeon]
MAKRKKKSKKKREKGYYRLQSPIGTAFRLLFLSLFVQFPGDSSSAIFTIINAIKIGYFDIMGMLPVIIAVGIFIISLIIRKKWPRVVPILCNTVMFIWLGMYMTWMSRSIVELLGYIIIDTNQINGELIFNGVVGLFWYIISFGTINRMKNSFRDLEPETDTMIVVIWVMIIMVHIFGILATIPAFLQPGIDFLGASGYESMISFLMYLFPIGYIIKLIMSGLRAIREFRRAKKSQWGLQQALLVVLFIFAWIPLLGHVIDGGMNSRDHSVYNTRPTGNSEFREYVESQGYETYAIQSSLSSLIRMNRSVVLVVFDPKQTYNPLAEVPFFIEMFNQSHDFSMLICDDHGSTTSLMTEMFLSSAAASGSLDNTVPLALFPKGTLIDNATYDTAPWFPIIQDFTSHPTTSGVTQVVLSRASAILGGDLLSFFGWETIGRSSASYSFVDVNGDNMYRYEDDNYPIPEALINVLADFAGLYFPEGIPLGGYPQVTFAAKEISAGRRIFLSSDASLFDNELITKYDNLQFAQNIMEWLTGGDTSIAIVFDESHNAPYGRREFNSAAMFGMFQGYINWLSTNPFLSWIYPLWAVRIIARWVPKEGDKRRRKRRQEEEVEEEIKELQFRTSSFFAEKINWYRINKEYNQALVLLYRRLERKINKMMGGAASSVDTILATIKEAQKQYMKDEEYLRIKAFLIKMEQVKKNEIEIVDESEFRDMFFEMEWVNEHIRHF